jgi:acyl-CoA thioester hydrolase
MVLSFRFSSSLAAVSSRCAGQLGGPILGAEAPLSSTIKKNHASFSRRWVRIHCLEKRKKSAVPHRVLPFQALPWAPAVNPDLVASSAAFGHAERMSRLSDVLQLRVRYSETDQMGTFYNSRALEWFECGRTELMRRRLGMSYAALEARGVFLPLVEAHLEFQGGARYDDLLEVASTVEAAGRARLRFDVLIRQSESRKPVVRGYTVHAFTDGRGKPIRPPPWFMELLDKAGGAGGGSTNFSVASATQNPI